MESFSSDFLVLEFLPAVSQMVFYNTDTLWFGVAGAALSCGVLYFRKQRYIFSSSTPINRPVVCVLAKMPAIYILMPKAYSFNKNIRHSQHRTLTQSI